MEGEPQPSVPTAAAEKVEAQEDTAALRGEEKLHAVILKFKDVQSRGDGASLDDLQSYIDSMRQ